MLNCSLYIFYIIQEPPQDYAIARHPKVIATPHLGANTMEAQTRVAVEIAEQFIDVVNGKSLFGAVSKICSFKVKMCILCKTPYYSKCSKILYTKVSDKKVYANNADPDQTAPKGAV